MTTFELHKQWVILFAKLTNKNKYGMENFKVVNGKEKTLSFFTNKYGFNYHLQVMIGENIRIKYVINFETIFDRVVSIEYGDVIDLFDKLLQIFQRKEYQTMRMDLFLK